MTYTMYFIEIFLLFYKFWMFQFYVLIIDFKCSARFIAIRKQQLETRNVKMQVISKFAHFIIQIRSFCLCQGFSPGSSLFSHILNHLLLTMQ